MEKSTLKTVIITGANSGLGFETAKKIACDTNFRLILACRNQEKAKDTATQIITETGNHNIICMKLDTASFKSVRQFEKDYMQAGFGNVYELRRMEDLENARKELEKNKEEKPVSQKMFRAI